MTVASLPSSALPPSLPTATTAQQLALLPPARRMLEVARIERETPRAGKAVRPQLRKQDGLTRSLSLKHSQVRCFTPVSEVNGQDTAQWRQLPPLVAVVTE